MVVCVGKEVCGVGAASVEGESAEGGGGETAKAIDRSRSDGLAIVGLQGGILPCIWYQAGSIGRLVDRHTRCQSLLLR